MKIIEKIRDVKLQCNINIGAAKISVLSFGKIYKYEYLTGEEILQSDQSTIKAFEKQIKAIENQGIKQTEASKLLKPE